MCQALRDLDIKSRAAESIVGDWQGPIVEDDQADSKAPGRSNPVRFVWKIDELRDLLLQGVECARRVPEICAAIRNGEAVKAGETNDIAQTLRGFAESVIRLRRAVRVTLSIIRMFESQGIRIARSEDLLSGSVSLNEIIDELEQLCEEEGWEVLNKMALPSDEFRALAAYLIETGKASA